jgi:hypothetical protein
VRRWRETILAIAVCREMRRARNSEAAIAVSEGSAGIDRVSVRRNDHFRSQRIQAKGGAFVRKQLRFGNGTFKHDLRKIDDHFFGIMLWNKLSKRCLINRQIDSPSDRRRARGGVGEFGPVNRMARGGVERQEKSRSDVRQMRSVGQRRTQ